MNLNSKFIFTPGRVVITASGGGTIPSVDNIPGTASVSGNNMPPSTKFVGAIGSTSGFRRIETSTPGGGAATRTSSSRSARPGGETGDNGTNRHSNFDKVSTKLAPKTAQFLVNRKTHRYEEFTEEGRLDRIVASSIFLMIKRRLIVRTFAEIRCFS